MRHLYRSLAAIGIVWAIALTGAHAATPFESSSSTPDRSLVADQSDRLQDTARRSGDLRLRILYSTEMFAIDERDPMKGVSTREIIPATELVEQARGATDPLVLDLMVQRCASNPKAATACDAEDFARRWTEADTQNQLAWLTLASVLKSRGDLDGARATFIRAAQASSWHEHDFEVARLVAGMSPQARSPSDRNAVLVGALGRGVALTIPFNLLGTFCNEDGEIGVACAAIVATMFRDTGTLTGLTVAAPYAKRAHVDPAIVASYLQESEAIHWAMQSLVGQETIAAHPSMSTEEVLRLDNARMQSTIDLGARRFGEQILLERHISRSEAAARYIATMVPWRSKQRADLLTIR